MATQQAGGTPVLPHGARRTPAGTGVASLGRVLVTAAAALVLVATAGCAAGVNPSPAGERPTGGDDGPRPTGAAPSSTAAPREDTVQVRLTIGDQEAIGTLHDNPAARDLVSLLPLTVPMGDLFGREKPGPLPRALTGEVEPVFTYRVGQIAYWPPGRDIFVVYDGDGLQVPGPGLVPLGSVDSGLDVVAAAGDDFDMTIAVLD